MRLERLTRAPESGGRIVVDTLVLDERRGVIGDRRSAKDGSVSLLSAEAEAQIRAAAGLCAGRFAANLTTSGLDYAALGVGSRLRIGAAELEIVRVGKPCFDECALFRQRECCPLPANCAFARVVRGGAVAKGSELLTSGA